MDVLDVRSGETVNLGSLLPAAKPVLVWFWAPHCPFCHREAPGVDAFASEHADELTVVGLGTQDNLELARSFVAEHGLADVRMLWDATFESWQALGVRGQPAALLVAGDGEPLKSWFGPFDEGEVLSLIGA